MNLLITILITRDSTDKNIFMKTKLKYNMDYYDQILIDNRKKLPIFREYF